MSLFVARVPLFVLFVTGTPVLAGGQATLESTGPGGSTMQISWSDDDQIRLNPVDQQAYMLVRDGKVYSVTQTGGRLMVMDVSSMASVVPQQEGMASSASGRVANARSVSRMTATGRTETVAGVEGEVYEIAWVDGNGEQHTNEAVLTENETVLEMTVALRAFGEAMAAAGQERSPDAVGKRLDAEGKGVLRFGDQFRVTALSDSTAPAGEFELPAEPMNMEGMMKGVQQMMKEMENR